MGQGEKETVNRDNNVRQGLGGKQLLKDLASGLQKEQSYSAALAGCRNLHLLQCSNIACKPAPNACRVHSPLVSDNHARSCVDDPSMQWTK